jgi:hypothetical protein
MTPFRIGQSAVALALVAFTAGCGSSSKSVTPSSTSSTAPASTTAATPAPQPAPRLSILSPRPRAHTGSTLEVSVALNPTNVAGAQRFRYVLDNRLTRLGTDRLTFHDLAAGHHRLEVLSIGSKGAHSFTTFTVRAPKPVPPPVPVEAPPVSSPPAPVPPPEPTPTVKKHPAPGIPQNGGGDGDGDNSGGPSDGDGNV